MTHTCLRRWPYKIAATVITDSATSRIGRVCSLSVGGGIFVELASARRYEV